MSQSCWTRIVSFCKEVDLSWRSFGTFRLRCRCSIPWFDISWIVTSSTSSCSRILGIVVVIARHGRRCWLDVGHSTLVHQKVWEQESSHSDVHVLPPNEFEIKDGELKLIQNTKPPWQQWHGLKLLWHWLLPISSGIHLFQVEMSMPPSCYGSCMDVAYVSCAGDHFWLNVSLPSQKYKCFYKACDIFRPYLARIFMIDFRIAMSQINCGSPLFSRWHRSGNNLLNLLSNQSHCPCMRVWKCNNCVQTDILFSFNRSFSVAGIP